jgi:hypothetical protein
VVFLTEHPAQSVAAIKILPANPTRMEGQLAHWKMVASLSHPHLIRLLDSGRCQLGGNTFLFVVTEHAEQTLAQILPNRALTADEARELLPPTLDALAYLHGKNLVQGALKPPNFLVVDDQLKLASDTIRPAGERTASTAKPSLYDPPEARNGRATPAGDVWGLGITVVEALTQTPPQWFRESGEPVSLPADLPSEFVDAARRCLNRDPAQRPAIAELAAQFGGAPTVTPSPVAPSPAAPPEQDVPVVRARPAEDPRKPPLPVIAITAGVIILAAVWGGVHVFHAHVNAQQAASAIPRSLPAASPAPATPPAAAEIATAASTPSLPTVLHHELPELSRTARESIRGVIKIAVRVIVDRSGNVVAAALDSRVQSKYFARETIAAAKKWRFAPTSDRASEVWRLDFELTRAGTTANATALR